MTPDPIWPAVVLAIASLVDAVFCAIPLRFVCECLDDVGLPDRLRSVLPPVKFAAAAGLIAGLWIPYLAAATALCLIVYFALAVTAHARGRDYGRNIINASILLAASVLVLATAI